MTSEIVEVFNLQQHVCAHKRVFWKGYRRYGQLILRTRNIPLLSTSKTLAKSIRTDCTKRLVLANIRGRVSVEVHISSRVYTRTLLESFLRERPSTGKLTRAGRELDAASCSRCENIQGSRQARAVLGFLLALLDDPGYSLR